MRLAPTELIVLKDGGVKHLLLTTEDGSSNSGMSLLWILDKILGWSFMN